MEGVARNDFVHDSVTQNGILHNFHTYYAFRHCTLFLKVPSTVFPRILKFKELIKKYMALNSDSIEIVVIP
jgi:hypothetical protein